MHIPDADDLAPSPNDWLLRVRQYLSDATSLIRLTYAGTARVHSMPELFRILDTAHNLKRGEHDERARQDAEEVALLAQAAMNSDFSMLHAHTLMGVWGALEAAVEDLAATQLLLDPGLISGPAFAKVSILVGQYESMGRWDRMRHLVQQLQTRLGADQAMGPGQFEKLLDQVGLKGSVPPRIRKQLVLAQQMRHVVAHRGGRADVRLMEACPWMGFTLNEPVALSRDQFQTILLALFAYVTLLEERMSQSQGWPRPEKQLALISPEWLADEA